MEGLNQVTLIGNLAADAELRYTQGGQTLLRFRMGCTDSWVNKDGERQERTEWVTCVLWGTRAEGLERFMTRGKPVGVSGRMQTRSWEQNGQKRYATEVVAERVVLLGGGRRDDAVDAETPAPAPSEKQMAGAQHGKTYGDDFGSDDIPF